mgnify:CR=1 FL=1
MNANGGSIRPLIVLTGKFQEGKSTLINQLLGGKYARTGNGLSTTRCCVRYCYGESESVRGGLPERPVAEADAGGHSGI